MAINLFKYLGILLSLSVLQCICAETKQTFSSSGSASGSSSSSGSFPAFPPVFQPFPQVPLPYFGFQQAPFYQQPFQPFPFFDFNTYNEQLQNWIKSNQLQAQQAAAAGHGTYFINFCGKKPIMNPFFATSAAQGVFGPDGGFASTFNFPSPSKDGENLIFNRFGPPPPGANQFGVSSFSSSSFVNNNGDKKKTQFSTVTINDNGNITTITSGDPDSEAVNLKA